MTRKTAVAAAAMSVASLVSATFAVASTMDLPILGFGSNQHAVTTTETTDRVDEVTTTIAPVEPTIVEQVVYEDVYQRVARPATPQAATPAPVSPTQPAPPQPALVTTTTAGPTTTVPTTTAPTTTAPTTTRAVTTTRPAPPPGCLEPEWDREYQRWHCKGD